MLCPCVFTRVVHKLNGINVERIHFNRCSNMMRRKLSFVGGDCCQSGPLTECCAESATQRKLRDRFDEECPYSLTRRSARSPRTTRNCNSQLWQVAVNTVAKKRDTLRRGVSSVFRSMNNLKTGFRAATQVCVDPCLQCWFIECIVG